MSQHTVVHPTLIDALWQSREQTKWIRFALFTVLGTVALWISAKIQIPFYPVPTTMQSFVILAMSMAFGSRLALATLVLYMLQGAYGLPVFAGTPEKGIGLAYMMGPTGGYLFGFVIAAWVVGRLAEHGWDRSITKTAAAMLIGNVIIYVPGILYLGSLSGWDKPVLEWGLYPFLYADVAKMALAAAILPFAWSFPGRKSG